MEIDYEVACKSYSDYWSMCTGSYIPDIGYKFELPIKKLETPSQNLNVRELEEHGMMKTLNYLLNMPDPDKKLTLCAYPQKALSSLALSSLTVSTSV